ncbi:MAG: S-layer homology domain-containing protein [Syntrophomonas sp.]
MNRLGRKSGLVGLIVILIFSLAAITWTAPGPAAATDSVVFPDINGDPNATFIKYLADRGLVKGFPDGTFRPNQGLTRAQATSLLVSAAGLRADASLPISFKDVEPTNWAAPSIAAAAQAGFISGFPDGTFHPEEKLTRAQAISMILRLSKQTSSAALPELTDIDSSHWAAKSAATGLASGMIGLTADKKQFLPNDIMSRSDLTRALGVLLTSDENLFTGNLGGQLKITGGTVNVTRTGTQNPVIVTTTTAINPGDMIQTGADGTAELVFPDGSGILIKENTIVAVKEARGRAYIKSDGTAGTAIDWLVLDLKQGKMFGALTSSSETSDGSKSKETAALNNSDYSLVASLDDGLSLAAANASNPWWDAKKTKKVKVRVDMPWGVASIRGTFWGNTVQANGQSATSLLTGEAVVTSGGQTVTVSAGQSTQITQPQAPPAPPAPMAPTQMREWAQAGDWANQRAREMEAQQEAPPLPAPPPVPVVEQPGLPPVLQPPAAPQQPPSQTPATATAPSGIASIISNAIHNAAVSSGSAPSTGGGGGGGGTSDRTPPAFINGYPAVENETCNTADLTVKTNESGKAYYVALLQDEVAEYAPDTAQEVKGWIPGSDRNPQVQVSSWSGSFDLSGDAEINTINYLRVNSSYKIYVVAEDQRGNLTPTVSVIDFQTAEPVATISGYVYEQDGVTAIAGVPVGARDNSDDHLAASTITADDGSYTLPFMENGEFAVYAWPGMYEMPYANTWYVSRYISEIPELCYIRECATAINTEENIKVTGINFNLAPGGSISGTIKDSQGNPLGEVSVVAQLELPNYEGWEGTETVSDMDGSYEIYGLPYGNYRIAAPGLRGEGFNDNNWSRQWYNGKVYKELADLITVDGQITGKDFILQTPALTGIITDALTKTGVSGLTINFRSGINARTGNIVATCQTGEGGSYSISNLLAGFYTGEITGTGYLTSYFNAYNSLENMDLYYETTGQNGTAIPCLSEGQTCIVLTWGESPYDLDSYLVGPTGDGGTFTTYYGNQSYEGADNVQYVVLDTDDTYSYGPETTTIYQQVAGQYQFGVRQCSYEGSFADSDAMVTVYQGSNTVHTFSVPTDQEGSWWKVFTLNGSMLTPVNTVSNVFYDLPTVSNLSLTSPDGTVEAQINNPTEINQSTGDIIISIPSNFTANFTGGTAAVSRSATASLNAIQDKFDLSDIAIEPSTNIAGMLITWLGLQDGDDGVAPATLLANSGSTLTLVDADSNQMTYIIIVNIVEP